MSAIFASQAMYDSSGQRKASISAELQTPSVIAILMLIFGLFIMEIVGVSLYWHEYEAARKKNEYPFKYSLFVRIIILVVGVITLLALAIGAILVLFVFPGPDLAQSYMRDKRRAKQEKIKDELEMATING